MKIKTLIIMDYIGSMDTEPEEEAENIAIDFQINYGITLDYDFSTAAQSIHDKEYKLVIFDYGGAQRLGADDMIRWQFREVAEWAREHPSRILLFWTAFTSSFWHWEIVDEFEDLSNVMFWDPVNKSGMRYFDNLDTLFSHQDEIIKTIKVILA